MRHAFMWLLFASVALVNVSPIRAQEAKQQKPTLTLDQAVKAAISKGVEALLKTQAADGSWVAYGTNAYDLSWHPDGPTALATYALLESGMSIRDPQIVKALDFLLRTPGHKTYDLGLRCNVWQLALHETNNLKYRQQLEKDADMLLKSMADGAYYYDSAGAPPPATLWDNSNTQYAILGMWAAARNGAYEVPAEYWWKELRHWLNCQNADGSWGYKTGPAMATMTAAGVASLFVCYDDLFAAGFIRCEGSPTFDPIKRGLDWMEQNFQGGLDSTTAKLYYLYGLERVGLASGYKYFGTSDWYKFGAKWIVDNQRADGMWVGGFTQDTDTSFALLFLSRGRNTVLFNKLQFPSVGADKKDVINDWNCRPRDLASLTSWISTAYEKTVNWQTINLKVPVTEWHDAPVLYIAGSREPKFTDEDIAKLRLFVLQGGTIFSCTQCDGKPFSKGIREVYRKLFPEYEMTDIPPTDDLYTKKVWFDIKGNQSGKFRLSSVSNGIRPLIIHTEEDLPKAWQLGKSGLEPAKFQVAANLVWYLTDKGSLRTRASNIWPEEFKQDAARSAKIVRLKWQGQWNPEPLALERFARLFSQQNNIKLEIAEPVSPADIASSGATVAILSGLGDLRLDAKDIASLKAFVNGKGTLLVDAAGGNEAFRLSAEKFIGDAFGATELRRLNNASPLYNIPSAPDGKITSVRYRSKTRARISESKEPLLKAVTVGTDDRVGLVYSREDISNAGLLGYDCYGVDGYDPGNNTEGSAYRVMRNIVLYAMGPAPATK